MKSVQSIQTQIKIHAFVFYLTIHLIVSKRTWNKERKYQLSLKLEPLITAVTRFLGTGFYRNLSYQAIPAVPAVVLLILTNLLICLASIYWWMHLYLCHDLNDILDMSILLLLNLLFLHSYICNNDRSDCSHRTYLLSWSPFHTTGLYILAVW